MSGVDELLGKASSILGNYFTQRLEDLRISKCALRRAFQRYGPRDWTDEEVSKEAGAFVNSGLMQEFITTLKLALMQAMYRITGKKTVSEWTLSAEDIVELVWQRWVLEEKSPREISGEIMNSQLNIQSVLQEMKVPSSTNPTPGTTEPSSMLTGTSLPSSSSAPPVPPGSQWEYNLLQQSQRP